MKGPVTSNFFVENREQEMIHEILNRPSLYKLTPKFREQHGFRGGEFFWLIFHIRDADMESISCLINNRNFLSRL